MLSNNRYKSQRRDLIQTQGSDDILVSGGLGGTTGKYMLAAKPGLITQRQTGARYSEEQVLNGLIGWWFLAEPLGTGTYYDFSGSDATIAVSSGSVPTEYTGIYGIVPRIDVGSGILSVSTAISISKFAPLTNASWTVATWVRFDTTAGVGNGGIADISENLVDAGKAFSIYRDTSSGVITYTLSGTISTISTTTVPLVGRWYHLALSYEYAPATGTGTYRIYLDGVLENTLTGGLPFAGNLANSGSIMRIGYIALGTIYLGGALNDFRVYRRALSTTEVGYLVGLKYGRLVPGLAAFGGNTTQTTRWQSGPINTNQLGQFVSEIGQSADGAPFQQTGQPVQPAAYALRGHWPLAGDNTNYIVDTSGAQISGTFGAGTAVGTQISDPEIGTMLALNGSPDYVNLTSAAGKMSFVNSGSFAVCMWVKLNNQYSSSNDPFFELGTLLVPPIGTGSHIYAFREVGTRQLIFTFYNNQLSSTLTLDNTLSHLAFTYNRSSRIRQIWINGQLAGQDTNVNPPLLTSLTRFRVGFNGNPSSVYLSGAISDFRIYSTALTQIEILQIIRQKLVNPGIDRRGLLANTRLIMPLSDPQTVGTSLSNIQDLSGYGHMGTPTNTQQILSIGTKKGLSFSSASSQRITIPSTTALSITDALTISFWIYPTSLASQITVISKQSYGEYEVVINTSGYIIFRHGSGVAGTQTNYTTENPALTANQWVFINITRVYGSLNNKSVSVWVNGISYSLLKTGTSETTYSVGSAGSSVFIGSTPSGTGYANMILSGLELSAICWTPNEIRGRMLQTQPQSFPVSSSSASISGNPGDNLALHLNAKDAVAILGASPQYLPDYSGYGHTANVKPVAGAVSFSAGATIPGGAARSLLFNGTTGYLICDGGINGREYLGPAGGTARTISMWVNPISLTGTGRPLISWGSALANTTAIASVGGAFEAYLNTTGNLVVALNSQADLLMTRTWDTQLTTGTWRQISLVVDPTAQPAEMIKCYTANATTRPSSANLVVETSNTTPNQLVCLLDLTDETPNGRLTDSSGYGNHANYVGQRWTSAGTFTYARIAHKQYELGGTIYIVGGVRSPGVYTGQVETFNGTTWAIGTALPQERAFHGGAVYNSAMYAIGGRITASGTATSTVITSTGGTWTSTTSLSGIRVECAAAVLGDYLYAIGGFTTGTGTTYLSSVEQFNGSTWTTTTSMNTARASPSVAVLNGYIYVMGGYNSTDLYLRTVERFDGSTWTLIQPMNYARRAASAIVQGNYIYVIGGATTGGATVNSVERFDGRCWTVIGTFPQALSYSAAGIYSAGNYLLHTGGSPTGAGSTSINTSYRAIKPIGGASSLADKTWGLQSSFTNERLGHGVYELNNNIYVVGGFRNGFVPSASVEVYNGTSWTSGTALPAERALFGYAVYNSNMYAVGGGVGAGSSVPTNTVIYSNGGSWSSAPSLSTIRAESMAAVLGNNLYSLGGYSDSSTFHSSVERFNGSSWTSTLSMNTARAGAAIAVYNGYIYVIGGRNFTTAVISTVERFDGINTWSFVASTNVPRYGATAAVIDNYLYVVSGRTGDGTVLTNVVERFDGTVWTTITSVPVPVSFAGITPYSGNKYLVLTGGAIDLFTYTNTNTAYITDLKQNSLFGEPVAWMNGVESNIVIPASTSTNLAANAAHTISMWVNPSINSSGTLFSAENTSSQDLCAIRLNSLGRVVYTMTNSSSITNTVSSNIGLATNAWYHITTTYDGSNMRLFLDGTLTNTTASSGTTATGTPRDIYIGADFNTAAKDYFSGNLGECRVYRTALTTNSVGALYSIGTQGINRSLVRTQPTAQLTIGRGFTGSQQATNFYSGYMDDIRVYDGLALSYPDMVAVWSNGAGNYYVGTNWRQPDPTVLGSNSAGVVLSSAPVPRQLANQTYYTATYTPSTGGLSYKGPGQLFSSAAEWDLNAKILTFTPNTTATGYTWTVSTGTNWTSAPLAYSAYSNTNLTGDDTVTPISLTNPFRFYGVNYSTLYYSNNGYFSFGTSDGNYPGSYTNLYNSINVSALRRDINVAGNTAPPVGIFYGYANSSPSTPNDTFIGTYLNVPNYSGAASLNNFQIVLYLNNAPANLAGNVIINYGNLTFGSTVGVVGLSNGGGETAYIGDGRGVDLSAGAPVSPDVYTLTATTSNLATRPSNITPATLLSQSLTCSNLVITNPLVQPYNLASNLAGWWQLNDLPASGTNNTLVDSSGLGHTATKTGPGQALWLVSPQNQPAIYLNGTQQNITIKDGSSATFPVSGSDYSISGWFNCFSNTSGANNAIIGISTNSDADRLVVYSAPDSNIIVSTSAANTTGLIPATGNAWNHLVITGTATDALGSNTRVYLNNYQIANTAATTTFASNDKFYLGSKRTTASGGTSTNYFTGLLSDFRIYNRRLQPTEIGQIYRGGNHGVMQTDAVSGVYSLACGGVPGIGSSTNSRLIKLVSPGFAQPPATPREPQQGNIGISVRVKLDATQPSIATLASSETSGLAGSWQLLAAPPQLQALKLWFALNDGVGATTAYNGAHTSPAYNATYTGAGSTWQLASPYGGVAPVFNGTANYVLVDNGSGLNADALVGADITICGWINTNSSGAGTRTVFGISASGTGASVLGLQFVGSGNTLTATIGSQTVTANGQAATNSWCFVALTIRAGIYVSLYLNNGGRGIGTPPSPYGADYYTATLATPLAIADTNMICIGAQPGSPSTTNYFAGGLADIRVYNKSLEPGEIESSYYNRMLPYFIMNTAAATPKVLAVGQTSLDTDKWYHIAVNYSASGRTGKLGCAEIWVNGRFSGEGNLADLGFIPSTAAGLSANTTANIVIGSSILGASENPRSYLQGKVDDLRISRQPFDPSVIQSIAGGWQDCVLAVGSVGLGGTSNISGLGFSAGSSMTTSAANGIQGAGVLVDTSSGYGSERRDYSNQISAFGGVQIVEDRLLGTQLIFNGTTSYCSIGGYLSQAYHRIFAISLWITPDATLATGTDAQILAKWTGSTDGSSCYKLAYDFTANTIIGSVGIGSRTVSVSATCRRALTHVIFQTTSTELLLYINGLLAGIAQLATTAGASGIINISNNTAVRIGSGSYGQAGTFFKGVIGSIRVFETILPSGTISELAGGRDLSVSGALGSSIARLSTVGYDSSRRPQINSGLVFWLSNPQLDLVGGNIASIAGTSIPQIRLSENSVYRARGVASNCSLLSGGSVGAASLGTGIQTLGSANSNLIFDGSDVLAQLAGSQSFSIAFWGKFYNSSPVSNETVLSIRDPTATTANTMIEIVRNSSTKAVAMNFGSGTATESSNSLVVADTNWHHWVITYGANSSVSNTAVASSKRNYYLDGVRVSLSPSSNIGRPMLSNCGVLALGTDYYSTGSAANIGLQDLRIYNRVLGVDDVALLYNMPLANSVGSTPIDLQPSSGSVSGYEIIGLRKRLVSPAGIPVSGVSGDVAAGDLIDTIGAGSGFARDNLVCAVSANPSNSTGVADQNWQVKPASNYRSPGYLSNAIIPSVASGFVLGGGATSNTILGLNGSPAVINLNNSTGNLYFGTSNLIAESGDWSVSFGVSAAGSVFSNSALMTFQGASAVSYRSWWLNSSNAGELMFQVDSTGTANGTGVFLPADGTWSHLAITKGQLVDGVSATANTLCVYQDGICRWQRVVNLNPSGPQNITLGAVPGLLSSAGFGGRLRDIQVYNSCLPSGVIRNLAVQSNQLMGSSVARPSGAPLHHWLFAMATSSNTVPDLGVLGSALGFSATGVSVQYRNQGTSLESWLRVAQPGLPSDGVGYFTGSGECIAYSCPVSRDGARTVAFWMRRAAISGSDEGLITWGTGSVSGGWFAIGLNSSGQISVRTSSTMTPRVVSTSAILDNRWYHISIVVLPSGNSTTGGIGNANNIRIFVNGYHDTLAPFGTGFEANPVNTVKSSSSSSDWLYVGSHGSLNYFSGWMDDIRVYGYALTPEEVLGLSKGAGQLAVVRR